MKSRSIKKHARSLGSFFLNLPLLFVILVPLLYTLCISVMPASEIYKSRIIPSAVQFSNYVKAFVNPTYPFLRFILNSFIVSTTVMPLPLLSCNSRARSFCSY